MARAALLPTPGDPFLLAIWLDFYKRLWHSEVDHLYVEINAPSWMPRDVLEFNVNQVRDCPNTTVVVGRPNTHGVSMRDLALLAREDLVVYMEDDAWVFKRTAVDEQFRRLEFGDLDIVGSPRGSCSLQICNAGNARWGIGLDPLHAGQPNWWPCFFFVRREKLLKTDLDFDSKIFPQGTQIPYLGLNCDEALCGDTFVWGSIQLRGLGCKTGWVEQYHSYPHDMELIPSKQHIASADCKWLHMGSMSGTMCVAAENSLIANEADYVVPLGTYGGTTDPGPSLIVELDRRFAWLKVVAHRAGQLDLPFHMKARLMAYRNNIEKTIQTLNLNRNSIEQKFAAYRNIFQWNE